MLLKVCGSLFGGARGCIDVSTCFRRCSSMMVVASEELHGGESINVLVGSECFRSVTETRGSGCRLGSDDLPLRRQDLAEDGLVDVRGVPTLQGAPRRGGLPSLSLPSSFSVFHICGPTRSSRTLLGEDFELFGSSVHQYSDSGH